MNHVVFLEISIRLWKKQSDVLGNKMFQRNKQLELNELSQIALFKIIIFIIVFVPFLLLCFILLFYFITIYHHFSILLTCTHVRTVLTGSYAPDKFSETDNTFNSF